MAYKQQIDERGHITCYRDTDTGETVTVKEYERRQQMQAMMPVPAGGQLQAMPPVTSYGASSPYGGFGPGASMADPGLMQAAPVAGNLPGPPMLQQGMPMQPMQAGMPMQPMQAGMPVQPMQGGMAPQVPGAMPMQGMQAGPSPLIQPGAIPVQGQPPTGNLPGLPQAPSGLPMDDSQVPGAMQQTSLDPTQGIPPTAGAKTPMGKNLRLLGVPHPHPQQLHGEKAAHRSHGFLDATSIAILLPTLVLLALIIAAAHKKRLFPWQTIRTFNPPSGMMTPRDYERSYLCPPNLRRHGRVGKRNPEATWSAEDGVVVPFGFLARTHLPITIPMGRLPNKNMFIVAPSGSGKTTLMRAIIKSLLAKPCVIIALEAKANDPNLDEKKEGFKYTVLPEAQHAGFSCLYFNPLDEDSVHWNPLDLPPITFASSIVQDVNSLDAEEQHWAERDMGYIEGLVQLLKWGAVQVIGEDENGQASELEHLPCNPRGLMKLVNNRRNIVESLRQLKNNPEVNAAELSELTQRLSSIIRTDADWDKNIQGVRGRLRMFKNQYILRVTERSNIDMHKAMHEPTVLIFGAPASLGPDAESLAGVFVYQLQQALHTRYGTASVLPLFAFFDEYQTLNIDLAGRLSAIVRGANGGLTVILQNVSQIASGSPTKAEAELRTIFSNSAIRVCLHNADEFTAKFFMEEIGKHAVIVPGIADHYQSTGFGIFPSSWNRIHSQQVVARVDSDTIKRMEKHHALVYLAPAGDPEFGETKPFMVDLRGIEEIARLHLLHNVTVRKTPPGAPSPGGPDAPPRHPSPGGAGAPGFMHVPNPADAINSAFNGEPNQSQRPEMASVALAGENAAEQFGQTQPLGGMRSPGPTFGNSRFNQTRFPEEGGAGQAGAMQPQTGQRDQVPAGIGQIAQVVSQGVQQVIGQFFGKPRPETSRLFEDDSMSSSKGPGSFASVPQGAADMALAGEAMRQSAGAFGAAGQQVPPGQNQLPGFAQTPMSADYDQLSSLQEASRAAAQAHDLPFDGAQFDAGQRGYAAQQTAYAVPQPYAGTTSGTGFSAAAGAAAVGAAAFGAAAGAAQPAQFVDPANRSCPHCGQKAGKGKFCIECGQFIGLAADNSASGNGSIVQSMPSAPGSVPGQSLPASALLSAEPGLPENARAGNSAMNNPMHMQSEPDVQQVVGPMGSRANTGKPQPRYGGLAVTPRDSMPSKRTNMVESAQQMSGNNPYQAQSNQAAPSAVDPRLAQGTGGMPGAGPLSQRMAIEREQAQSVSPYQRTPVHSLNPDVSKFGFNKQQNNVEF